MVRSQRISQSSRGDDPLQLIAAIQPPCLYADPVALIKRGAADVLAGPCGGAVAKFWRSRPVRHVSRLCPSEPEVADDPERPCREAEASVQGRFQGSALRGIADPAGRLMVSALSAQLP